MLPLALLAAQLASSPHIELYTMGQGEHVFERFGHAALCVVHERRRAESRCYNYGTTDFGSPPEEIGWAFLRGKARFWVSEWPLERMLGAYRRSDRTIWRQRLPLSPDQVRQVIASLEHDAREENRYYLYHHFFDNCTTRVRDVVDASTGGALTRDGARPTARTFRELGRQGLAEQPAALFFGDLLVGRAADRAPSVREAMFLPDVLREQADKQLGAKPELVYARRGRDFLQFPPSNVPAQAALALCLAAPVAFGRRAKRIERALLAVTGVTLGLVGLVVWLVAAVSTVPELRANELLAVFWPTDVALGALQERHRKSYITLRLCVLLFASVLAVFGALRQPVLVWIVVAALPLLVTRLGRAE